MDEFEYITLLLSIILGLGVTQLLSGLARLLRDGLACTRLVGVAGHPHPAARHPAGDALAQAFIERRRAFQAIIALVPLASFVQQRLLSGEMPQADLDTLLHVCWIAVAVPGFVSRRNAVQACVALLSLALMLVYICLLFVDLRQAQARPAIARRRLTRSRRRGRSRPRRRAAAQRRRSSSAPDTARRSTAS